MKKFIILGLLVSVIIGFFLSPYASSFPDGLERVAIKYGFMEREKTIVHAPFPDYQFKPIKSEKLATSVAGLFGTVLIFFTVSGLFKVISNKGK